MGVRRTYTPDFTMGEIDEQFLRRADQEQLRASCKRFRNAILRPGGGFERRPGTEHLADLTDTPCRVFRFDGAAAVEDLVFENGKVKIYADDGTLEQTITGAPWTTSMLGDLSITASGDGEVYVFHEDMAIQALSRASSGTWSRSAFSFAGGFGDEILQPYYRFAPPGVTMNLSAYTGSGVTMTLGGTGSSFLTSDFVGVRFRYAQANEVEITGVTDGQTATVDINGEVYPNIDIQTSSPDETDKFKVGHVVAGKTSERRGVVTGASGTTVAVLMLDGYDFFIDDGGTIEDVVGPEGSTSPVSQATRATPRATTLWDEQLVSAARGYPATGLIHRGRLFMGGFPNAPSVIAASSSNDFDNFTLGDGASDAMVVALGDDPNAQVRHFLSAEQLLLFTDRGAYYVPEGGDNPITPTSIAFLRIAPEGCSDVPPALAAEGALFFNKENDRLMAVLPTGNVRRSWEIIELTEAAAHLIDDPARLAVANGLDGRPERYVLILNSDGTLAVGMYRRGGDRIGFGLWSHGYGSWTCMSAVDDEVRLIADHGSAKFLSRVDLSSVLDDERGYTSAVTARDGLESHVAENGAVVASGTVSSGEVADKSPASGLTIGADFAVEVTPAPPIFREIGLKRMRIPRYWLELMDSGTVRVGGVDHAAPLTDSDVATAGFTRDRVVEGFTIGWSYEPTLTIEQQQGAGAAMTVRALTYEVAF